MNKARLIELIRDPSKIHEKDLTQLKELISQYPYSQILHILNAKGNTVLNLEDAPQLLHKAATYSSDRILLKHTIEDIEVVADSPPWEEEIDNVTPVNFDWIEEGSLSPVADPETPEQAPNIPAEETTDHEVADLDQSTATTEEALEEKTGDLPEAPEPESPGREAEPEQVNESSEDLSTTPESEQTYPDESMESLPEEANRELLAEKDNSEATDEVIKASPQNIDDPLDLQIAAELHQGSIHEELMNNLNKLQKTREQYQESPDFEDMSQETEGHQEQIEIIDKFIKNSPLLSKPNLSADSEATNQKDLSKSSATFNDDLVSEQLARILIKQGNKKEAVKIYKKLIRKFPKKKSYFAGQIENLSKK